MSRAVSPSTGQTYGVARVVRTRELAPPSFHYQRGIAAQPERVLGRRRPKTATPSPAGATAGARGLKFIMELAGSPKLLKLVPYADVSPRFTWASN
jgi:hypothetical protein